MKKILLIAATVFTLCIGSVNAQINVQRQSMWCWASCIESVLLQRNIITDQVSIAARLSGWPQNRPATLEEVAMILRSYNQKAWTVNFTASPQQLYQTISAGYKIIAFVKPMGNTPVGHFIVVQGINFDGSVIVSDPATGMTYSQSLQQLYYGWNWMGSIVTSA